MAAVVQELVTKFSFVGNLKPQQDFNANLTSSIKFLGGAITALHAAAGAFAYWADGVLTGVDSLGALSKQTKIAAATIQELNYAAEQSQSTSGAMESTLQSLTKTIGTAALKGSEDFARLGISVRGAGGQIKTADQVLDDVRKRFVSLGLSMAEQEHFASALGIDSSLLQLLNRTDAEMGSLRNTARGMGTVTADQVEQAERYKKAMAGTRFALMAVRQSIAVGVAPELTRLAEGFIRLVKDNKDWVINGVQFAVKWIGYFLEAFNRLLPVIGLIAAGLVIAKIAALGFAGVMGIVLSPVVVITAAIVALFVIIDDLIVAFQGGQSVIADFFQEFLGIDIVAVLKGQFEWLMGWINKAIDGWKILIGLATGHDLDEILGSATTIPAGTAAAGAGATMDNRQVNQQVQIQIATADPQAAGKAVQDGLQRQLEAANAQLGTGGR
jgi:hypothetical protein